MFAFECINQYVKMAKTILITGASGFIGSFFVEEALQRKWTTWAGIRRSSSREYLQDAEIRLIDLNFSDKEKLKAQILEHCNQFGKWDYIIHNAGATKCLNINDFDKVNYGFTKNFVEALQETNCQPEKFLFMSSLSANHPRVNTAYGRSKQKAEQLLESQTGFPYMILCPTGVYGPRDKDYFLMLKTLKTGLNVAAGFRPQELTFIYVKDVVKAAFAALESPLKNRKYPLSDGQTYSDREYTKIAQKTIGIRFALSIRIPICILYLVSVVAENWSKLSGKPSALNRDKFQIMKERDWRCDSSSIEHDLNFRAEYDLSRGMKESVEWYREHRWL